MSILESFYVLFKSDTTDLKKGTEDVKKTVKSLNDFLTGGQGTVKATEKVGASFKDLAIRFGEFVAVAAAAQHILTGLASATQYGLELAQVARLLNVNVEALDAWGRAVQRTGGTAAGFNASLASMAEKLHTTPEIALKYLPRLADQFQRLGRFRSLQYGKNVLGLDEPTILLIQRGSREVQRILNEQRALGVVTKQDAEIFLKFNDALVDVRHASNTLYTQLASEFLPILEKIYRNAIPVFEYFTDHKQLIVGALIAIGSAAAYFVIPWSILTAEFLLTALAVTALVAAFALLFEDLEYYFEGKDSLIGRATKSWEKLGEAINKVKSYIPGIGGLFAPIDSAVGIAKFAFNQASSSGVNSAPSNSFFNSGGATKSTVVNLGGVTVNTQATDVPGIGTAFSKSLFAMLQQVNDGSMDGVAI